MWDRLRWYGARLSTMSVPEIGHRVLELGRKSRFRAEKRGWDAIAAGSDAPFAVLSELQTRLRQVPASCGVGFDPALALGRRWPASHFDGARPRDSLWRFDPISERAWPGAEQAGFDIDVRSTNATPDDRLRTGDVKFVWEPARLQALQWLAVRAAQGDRAAFEDGMAWVQSWMSANPPWRGVHWTSGIEIALRIVSVVLLIAGDGTAAAEAPHRSTLLRFLKAHAIWLVRFPSLHSSANNHRVAEGLGLFLAGMVLPASQEATAYAREGRHILEVEASQQILPDGVGAEQSPTYQGFTMEMLALGQLVARALGVPLAAVVDERLRRGAAFLAALQDDAGRVPAIGDDDEGRVVASSGVAEPLYVASIIHAVAGLLGEPSQSCVAPGYLREALFGALDVVASAPRRSFKDFAAGGYVVVRDEAANHRYHLIFDRGPLGYLSLAAHGHADALAIWLNVDGQPLFIDAGTWLYHSGRETRRELRRSQAHNTVSVQGGSQSEPSSAFSWKNAAKAEALFTSPQAWSVEGAHDGYLRALGVRHARRITRAADGFVIQDRLIGAKSALPCTWNFLLAEEVEAEIVGDKILLSQAGRFLASIAVPAALTASVERGRYAPQFGMLRDTWRIALAGDIGEEGCMIAVSFVATTENS
ncbi:MULTISPECIES: alginate lyase family protein [unclassified Beijerinckia]|uniref:heparinase II/III family protein n=1 Tax=unclassified Beijerinckia TaxID=2638183 RepID=UPI0008947EA5|nr:MULTISPECIES: alginate lyase family protein [unclassified Beijerinckia]MDH7794170.1 hypothetical protein [Beijerinckia sp. GAS462]SEB54877.1 Heparinase II/III N-terminus [Beijerinckia sp. 28-YEA-48]